MNFISDDKKVITLPVPLGDSVYVSTSNCGDFCMFQKELFNNNIPERDGTRCFYENLCHTTKAQVDIIKMDFNHIKFIKKEWGIRAFDNFHDAMKAAKKSVEEHRKEMRSLGFYVNEDGYGFKKGDING